MNDDDDVFDEHGVLRPGKSVRVSMTAMDAAVIGLDGSALSLHRPGFRVLADRSLQDARARAYDEMVRRAEGAWKSEAQRIAETEQAAGPPLSEDPREDAYLRSVRSLENAWRDPR